MKKLSIIAVLSLFTFILNASDFGVVETAKSSISNTLDSPADPLPWDIASTSKVFASIDFDSVTNLYISGYYNFYYNGISKKVSNDFDLTDLSLKTTFVLGDKNKIDLTLGRTLYFDFSAQVLAHKLDGLIVSFNGENSKLKIGVGTTALLFNKMSSILLTSYDNSKITDTNIVLAPARLVGQIGLSLDSLSSEWDNFWSKQGLNIEALGQMDLRTDTYKVGDTTGTAKPIPVNSYYLGAGLNGKLSDGVFYKLSGYFMTGTTLRAVSGTYADSLILAGLGDLTFNIFAKSFLNSRFDIGLNISTGDEDAGDGTLTETDVNGTNSSFFGISKRSGGLLFSPQHGNAMSAKLSWSGKIIQAQKDGDPEMSFGIDYFLTGRPANASIATSGALKNGTKEMILGNEIDMNLSFRLLSDLSVKLYGGVFLPNTNALGTSFPSKWKSGIELNLSF